MITSYPLVLPGVSSLVLLIVWNPDISQSLDFLYDLGVPEFWYLKHWPIEFLGRCSFIFTLQLVNFLFSVISYSSTITIVMGIFRMMPFPVFLVLFILVTDLCDFIFL